MFRLGEKVKVVNVEALENDDLMEDNAIKIIKNNDYIGKITKINEGIHFVGFNNKYGWVTQGYKENEIKAVKQ